MTSDGEALFRAICEEPWEDAPRLAYADWMEETGVYAGRKTAEAAVRAAYIRHQVAFARRDSAALRDHARRMETEFAPYLAGWGKELPELPGVTWCGWERGFVAAVRIGWAKPFREHADAVFAAAPISRLEVQRLTAKTLAAVLESPYLRRIESFQPVGKIGDDGVRRIARCANLCNLAVLELNDIGMTDAGMEALAAATVFDRLQLLAFVRNLVTDRAAYALLDSVTLNELKRISWYPNRLSAAAVGALRQRFADTCTITPAH